MSDYYSTRMPFGKFKGRPLTAIPDCGYLLWLLSLNDLEPALRFAVQREIARREADQSPPPKLPDLRPVADEWRRRMSREFHPDFGGTHEGMKAINRGYDVLIGMVEAIS